MHQWDLSLVQHWDTHFFQASALLSNPSELRSLTDPSLLPDTNLATPKKTSQSVAQVLAYTTASESQHLLCLPRVISPCSQPGCFSRVLEICFVMTKTSNCRYFILHPPLPPSPQTKRKKDSSIFGELIQCCALSQGEKSHNRKFSRKTVFLFLF